MHKYREWKGAIHVEVCKLHPLAAGLLHYTSIFAMYPQSQGGGAVLPYFGYLRMCGNYGWVCENVCAYDGCFFEHPSIIMRTFQEILLPLGVKKWPFSFKMTQFLPIMGGFSPSFAPMMGVSSVKNKSQSKNCTLK